MKINIREDSVTIEGYVNAIERNSKPLLSRAGKFIERICQGAFKKALKRNDHVVALLNHNRDRVIGSMDDGSLELEEDNIGLRAKLETSDAEVVKDAKEGNLVGWSFGFTDTEGGVEKGQEQGLPLRMVRDMNLMEVSLLNRARTPAYDGTLVMVRDDEEPQYIGEEMLTDPEVTEETRAEEESKEAEMPMEIDYSKYEAMIKEMREDK